MAERPVEFAPGRYVRLKRSMNGVPAGAEGMISGEVLFLPAEAGRLRVIINPADPGARDYRALTCLPEDLEWAEPPEPWILKLHEGADILTEALNAEHVAPDLASRILNRFLFGDPRGLDAGPLPAAQEPCDTHGWADCKVCADREREGQWPDGHRKPPGIKTYDLVLPKRDPNPPMPLRLMRPENGPTP